VTQRLASARMIILCFIPFLFACSQPKQKMAFVDETKLMMDTVVRIVVYDQDKSKKEIGKAVNSAFMRIAEIERQCSNTIKISEINQINRSAGIQPVRISDEVSIILQTAQEIARLSDGAFDISIYPVLKLWNFTSEDKQFRIPETAELEKKLNFINYKNIQLNNETAFLQQSGMAIDVGGIAKGFAIDQAYEILCQAGISDFMIDAGGDLQLKSGPVSKGKRRVWIKHPRQKGYLWGYFRQDDGAVATSGDYERFFEMDSVRYHHILNPKTGLPARQCFSVTILAKSAMLADALATAVFVLGPQKGLTLAESLENTEAVILFPQQKKLTLAVTSGLKDKIIEEIQRY
jgi:thiamine biosynthesis lipoprotein